ncbi:hypothetical protein [Pedobacter cryoconitis]|uniref:Putative small secreted protein n=1 Tax=Pedobacter cryoconitis TaxID=188932 RepID=A0A7X0MKE2_9SPHI|nr:hypothetical protein [Pedobacter cryoconitis]MBB6502099.1 putative small secreted protein [Pedobacter cryoconitis]
MKRIYSCLLISSLFLAACNSAESGKTKDVTANSKIALRSFRDTTKLDTFKIELKGDHPKNMELVFTITPQDGHQIYTKTLKAKELLDNYKESVDLGKTKEQIQFIKEELNLFFDEENFIEPAVTENEKPDNNTPDKVFFEELKKTGLNGFKYRLGKESKVYIAWSEADKKVKNYYECCK